MPDQVGHGGVWSGKPVAALFVCLAILTDEWEQSENSIYNYWKTIINYYFCERVANLKKL